MHNMNMNMHMCMLCMYRRNSYMNERARTHADALSSPGADLGAG